MSIEIKDGGQIEKDPSDVIVCAYDWSQVIATDVQIAASEFSITGADALLTKDAETIDGQMTLVRLTAGTIGQVYYVASQITTNEITSQTLQRSFRVYVRNR